MNTLTQQLMMASGAVAEAYNLSFISSSYQGVSGSSVTFSSQAIGATSNSRREIFVVVRFGTDASTNLSSATIGGTSATLASSNVVAAASSFYCFFAEVNTNTSADIVLNFSRVMSGDCFIAVYRVVSRPNIGSNQTDSDNANVSAVTSMTISANTINANGFGLGVTFLSNAETPTSSHYTLDASNVGSNSRRAWSYSRIGTSSQTPSQQWTWTTSGNSRGILWAFN